jgi:uncharacterized protein
MKILVSPTKTMAFDKTPANLALKMSPPRFENEAGILNRQLQTLNFKKLKQLFKVSDGLTQKTLDQIQNFSRAVPEPALFIFQGEAFKTMDPCRFTVDQLKFANEHLQIFSGLYGVLRPMDGIKPYRLDFNTPLRLGSTGLKQFWRERVIPCFKKMTQKDEVILNLASEEYSSILWSGRLKDQMITLQFRQREKDKLKAQSVRAKQARGLFAAQIIQQQMTKATAIKKITLAGYAYSVDLSTNTEWFFVR